MKASRNIAIHVDEPEQAKEFYRNILGLSDSVNSGEGIIFGDSRLFVEKPCPDDSGRKIYGQVFELLVEDVEVARDELLGKGCRVLLWEGKGRCCYLVDPFGVKFNLWQV